MTREGAGKDQSSPNNVCSCCCKRFSTAKGARKHELQQRRKRESFFVCPEPSCGKTFSTKQNLLHHVRGRHSTQVLFCTSCERVVSKRGWMSSGYQHRRKHGCTDFVWLDETDPRCLAQKALRKKNEGEKTPQPAST